MREVLPELEAWTARGEAVATATVVATRRSAPRPVGHRLAVSRSGEIAGAVSGGCVEGAVVAMAEEVLAGGPPRLERFGIADEEAWDVGLPCGGEIDVWIERHEPTGFEALVRDGRRGALVTVVAGEPLGARLLVAGDGTATGSLGDPALDARALAHARELMAGERGALRREGERLLFVDVAAPRPRLVIVGAIDLARALCRAARELEWAPYVIDPRRRFARADRFPEAERVIAAWPEEGFAALGPLDAATAVAVITHDPKVDDPAVLLALRSGAGYVGAMGSREATRRRRERLLEAGLGEAELARLAAPIGLDLGAATPAGMAVSIVAEILARRAGRAGGRLAAGDGAIHG